MPWTAVYRLISRQAQDIDPRVLLQNEICAQSGIDLRESSEGVFHAGFPGEGTALVRFLSTTPLTEGWRTKRILKREISNGKPLSASNWLAMYLEMATRIIEVSTSEGTDAARNASGILRTSLRTSFGGLWQIEGEGFTNEAGAFILLSNPNGISGKRLVATLREDVWVEYTLDANNPTYLRRFADGVPPRTGNK
ncbi:MAG: hypothetical protein WC712_10420 [Candidatus Brocadiia bacterium]